MSPSKSVNTPKIEINKFSRYIEVSLGASQSLLHFNPSIPCFLNDTNTDLINFYKNINEPELQKELNQFSEKWNLIGKFSSFSSTEILVSFQDYTEGIISNEDISYIIRAIILLNMNHEEFIPLFEKSFVVSIDMFSNSLIKSVVDELLKLKGDIHIDEKNSDSDLFRYYIEQAFRSGFYEHFKSLVNWQKTELIDCISLTKHLASWFFLKELRKGHHLQYDLNGNLKNHYGGANCSENYFETQVNKVCDPIFLNKISTSNLYNLNPYDFLKEIQVNKDDIVVVNLLDTNLILAQGKNHSGLKSQLIQLKQIVNFKTNLIFLINDEEIALDFQESSNNTLNKTKLDRSFYLSNLK